MNRIIAYTKVNKYNYEIVSLGYNCYIKNFLKKNNVNQETNVFDWIGSEAWVLEKIIFDKINFLDKNDFKVINIKNEKMAINIKYYLRFKHDLKHDLSNFEDFKSKYVRRLDRLDNILKTKKKILFYRLETSLLNRDIFENHKHYYEKSELYYLEKLINKLKLKYPNTKFKLIYFSYTHPTKIKENIHIINTGKEIDKWENSFKKLQYYFTKHYTHKFLL
ncbi:putative papain-like cysteine protease [Cafeteria roenbergensis virus]|uniref:Putative papain-like cysteine protease n=1 Tax=Cafeteria roenbergensis virus (strain BV-PW1) TaxID=693272 RepID=E3T4N9_CROVB|nr:putative papain-like cysteine protease [Cafeteria roenbergensis virus BV-PW1]ADO67152.1 putative papain-like cysteine protease [Cafeteria roenbergensis virus BV-PW1]